MHVGQRAELWHIVESGINPCVPLSPIQRALHAMGTAIACFKQMRSKAMAQRVGRDRLAQASLLRRLANGLLDHAFMQMETIQRALLPLGIFGQP